jgi:Mn2+/Fe2+ NRAMP family transporter
MLVAATGVGAGDLITASLGGSEVGLVVAWAALAGALLKWTLNEGVARWQMATGTTLLEGWVQHLHPSVQWLFLAYFLLWSFVVGGALVNACGVAGASLLPFGDPDTARIVWGVVHSLASLVIVLRGGYAWFEKAMAACVGIMAVGVVLTAGLLWLSPEEVAPVARTTGSAESSRWALAVLGGVGGTVTLLAYGYWIAERRRSGREGLVACRVDLGVAYAVTALFGASMIVIGSRIEIGGRGAGVALDIAAQIGTVLGAAGSGAFLLGFWGAVFSSILGVWQSAPYLFADFVALRRSGGAADGPIGSRAAYRWYMVAMALITPVWLLAPVRTIQLIYATLGAAFLPLLAITLLILNNRRALVRDLRNGWVVNLLLIATVLVFGYLGVRGISD